MDRPRTVTLAALALALGAPTASATDFSAQIQPILEGACVRCHNPQKVKGDLMLHTREALMQGGSSGAAVVPGMPDEGELIARVSLPHDDDDIMPQEADPLSNPQIAILRDWIEAGAEWPEGVVLQQKERNARTLAAAVADDIIPDTPPASVAEAAARVDRILRKENAAAAPELVYTEPISDLAFLRKASVDLIGRIPTVAEIEKFEAAPAATRREDLVDALLAEPRFAERWTVFFADMLRIRANADGGRALLAYVHRAVAEGKPYDELVRELIASNGKVGKNPAVGFVLNDEVDPMALAGATSQIFLGVRLQCAECHDHPYDDWKQKEFYEFASYFGKTRRMENRFARSVYTTEAHDMAVQWPPEREQPDSREPVRPRFPFELISYDSKPHHIARLEQRRGGQGQSGAAPGAVAANKTVGNKAETAEAADPLDALLDIDAGAAAGGDGLGAAELLVEARRESAALEVEGDLYRPSELRGKLAGLITDPRNPYFARAFTNRVWAELIGRGFVEPLDNFSDYNGIRAPQTLNFLAGEFIASGYDLRTLIKTVVLSAPYARGPLPAGIDPGAAEAAESHFAATRTRRMLAEALFDSVVAAGHLEDHKWPAGANVRTVERQVRVPIDDGAAGAGQSTAAPEPAPDPAAMAMRMVAEARKGAGGYDLESGIGLDFADILAKADAEASDLAAMKQMSDARIEAERMAAEMRSRQNRPMRYRVETVEETVDDNPRFDSSLLVPSPAPPSHFLRVFGQPSRAGLGEFRDESPSLRQALMLVNGKATHEAARVGPLEPLGALLADAGTGGDFTAAVRHAYLETLTRRPDADELAVAAALLAEAAAPEEGMSDLRWALLNCHEFRYLP